jgi:hypothetical protein
VGIMDIDICGPSIPKMMRVEKEEVRKSGGGWEPVWARDTLGVMSIGFLLGDADNAVIWRGPRKDGLIKQFLVDVNWGALDFLIVDGTRQCQSPFAPPQLPLTRPCAGLLCDDALVPAAVVRWCSASRHVG